MPEDFDLITSLPQNATLMLRGFLAYKVDGEAAEFGRGRFCGSSFPKRSSLGAGGKSNRKISDFCAEWATPMSDDPPICKSNGFALQRKPNGGRITLNAASIWGGP